MPTTLTVTGSATVSAAERYNQAVVQASGTLIVTTTGLLILDPDYVAAGQAAHAASTVGARYRSTSSVGAAYRSTGAVTARYRSTSTVGTSID